MAPLWLPIPSDDLASGGTLILNASKPQKRGCDDPVLFLNLLSARDHPDHDFRGGFGLSWKHGSRASCPTDTHEEALALLENAKGTFLEPFRVRQGQELAALLLSYVIRRC